MSRSRITPRLMKFLDELARNNHRDWFAANKERYECDVLEPALALIEDFVAPLARDAPVLQAIAKRTGGSLMRIYRDTRFSRDKTPYKLNVGIQFRHELGRDVHAPSVYLHLEPKESFLGVGIWRPGSPELKALRTAIYEQSARWRKVVTQRAFLQHFQLAGDSLQRIPRGFPADHECEGDLKRIDFVGVKPLKTTELYHPQLVSRTMAAIRSARPFLNFLCDALNLPF